MRRLANGFCCCLLAVAGGAVPAQAGTVQVVDGAISYTAASGEANVVTVTSTGLTETGAPLSVGTGCTLANPTAATCAAAYNADVVANLGDGDDSLDGNGTSRSLWVRGGGGADQLTGGWSADVLFGDSDADTLVGDEGSGSDSLFDQDWDDDLLIGGPGPDVMRGGARADVFDQGAALDGADTIDGQGGLDAVAYDERSAAVIIDLVGGTAGQIGEADVLRDVEDAYGGAGDDILAGNDEANILVGGEGGDRITGEGQEDVLAGEGGADRVFARDAWADLVDCGAGDDRADLDPGHDVVSDCETDPPPPPLPPPPPVLNAGRPAPFTRPALSVGVSARPGIRRGILRVRVSGAARAMLTATVQGTVGKRRVVVSAAGPADDRGTSWLSLRLTPSAWRHIRRTRRGVPFQLTVTAARDGETATARATIRVFPTRVLPWPLPD